MDFKEYQGLVKNIPVGKSLPDSIYVHESALDSIPEQLRQTTLKIGDALKIPQDSWNIIKYYRRDFKLALLHYPAFERDSYPALSTSYTVDLSKLSMRKADYSSSDNPPILHRKETFVGNDHPLRETFKAITAEGEAIGLYENVRKIGFKKSWERLISSKGCYLDGDGRIHKSADRHAGKNQVALYVDIERHKTAIDRYQLSQPMQILARHNYFNGEYSVLDYGCGKGDDVRELEAHGIDVSGWDPIHNPEGSLINSDIVNLGFVLNVIEDRNERDETLKRAWKYADRLLIVSVMVAGESVISQFTPYKDGVITSRKTFQRYYNHSEFREYLESVLAQNAIAVGQGIFVVFKDKLEEQNFLLERQHIRRDWRQLTERERVAGAREITEDLLTKHENLFNDFWDVALDLGRIPANSEFEFSEELRRIAGSHHKALKALLKANGDELYLKAQNARRSDLIVYFALGLFGKRQAYKHMPEGLKRDIKAFFQTHGAAVEEATKILFSVGNPAIIEDSAVSAYKRLRHGEFNDCHSWIIHKELLPELPAELRIYVGCASQLYGDLNEIDLIKIHFASGKVSFMKHDDWSKNTPCLVERIKVRLRDQDIDFYNYDGRYSPIPLESKAVFTCSTRNITRLEAKL